MEWNKPADQNSIDNAVNALKKNNIVSFVVSDEKEAKDKVMELIPMGSEVLTLGSLTAEQIGITKEVNEGSIYKSVKNEIKAINDDKERLKVRRMKAASEYVVGSVHAVTEDGKLVAASATGSQLPPILYSAGNVILVVGTQKIVKNLDDAFKRIQEYSLPLESERMMKKSGYGSSVNKIIIINREGITDRIKVIFIKKNIGF